AGRALVHHPEMQLIGPARAGQRARQGEPQYGVAVGGDADENAHGQEVSPLDTRTILSSSAARHCTANGSINLGFSCDICPIGAFSSENRGFLPGSKLRGL